MTAKPKSKVTAEQKAGARTSAKRLFDPTTLLAKATEGKSTIDCEKDHILFLQGDPADAIFYIQTGTVKLSVLSAQGKEAVIALLGDGDFFGEGCLAGQSKRMAAAVAMSKSSLVRLEKTTAIRLLRDDAAFASQFVAHLLSRNIRIEEDLVDQLFNSSEKRLARVLLLLANFGKEGATEHLTPAISQETLAGIVGTTRSRVSHFMNKFRKLGFIDYNGGLEVHSSLLNVVLHD